MQHLHYFSSLHSRKTICTPDCTLFAPAFPAWSHCLLAAILPVIMLLCPESSPNQLQPGHLTIVCSGSLPPVQVQKVSLFPLKVVMNPKVDSGSAPPRAGIKARTRGGFILSTHSTTCRFGAEEEQSVEARRTEGELTTAPLACLMALGTQQTRGDW